MRKTVVIFLAFLSGLFSLAFGQERITATGECDLKRGMSYETAVDIATECAKREAVIRTCGNEVSSFSLLRTRDDNTRYHSNVLTNSYGLVKVVDKVVTKKHKKVSVTITGDVYDISGPKYLDVTGLMGSYKLDQNITFDVRFFNNSYLKIFWFNNLTGCGGMLYDGSYQFHPSPYPVRFPDAQERVNFKKMICPWLMTPDEIRYEWCRTHEFHGIPKGTDEDMYVTLVFVATNSNVPYTPNTVNEECFLNWWCSLPCSERSELERKSIIIKL